MNEKKPHTPHARFVLLQLSGEEKKDREMKWQKQALHSQSLLQYLISEAVLLSESHSHRLVQH